MTKNTTGSANEKAIEVQLNGSNSNTTSATDCSRDNPTQLELRLEIRAKPPNRKKRKYGLKSTATGAQYERIDRMFDREGKTITTLDFRKAGVHHPAGRIKEMNEKLGYCIPTVALRSIYDDEGFLHPRIAVYELIDRPKRVRGASI